MTTHAHHAAQRSRHARIRWELLRAMHGSRTNQHGGWATGRYLLEVVAYLGGDFRVESDDEGLGLLQDLVAAGYARSEDNREDRAQVYGLDHLTFRIEAKGIAFVNRAAPPDAMVDDGRIVRQ